MILYSEKQNFTVFRIIMVFVIGATAFGAYSGDIPLETSGGLILLFAVLLIVFSKLTITLTEETLSVGFGFIKSKIKVEDIAWCEETTIKFGTYLGMGIRYGFDGTKAYNTRFGKAVKIKIKGKKRDLVVTGDKPEELCMILRNEIKRWKEKRHRLRQSS